MTRLVITVDAEADESKILRELETKAGSAVAARSRCVCAAFFSGWSKCRGSAPLAQRLARMSVA
jgi:hypothetical protein